MVAVVGGGGAFWRYSHLPRVAAVVATRGTAVEIVYATGGVEPVRWAKVASVIRDRIVETCDCEGKPSPKATCWRGSTIAKSRRR